MISTLNVTDPAPKETLKEKEDAEEVVVEEEKAQLHEHTVASGGASAVPVSVSMTSMDDIQTDWSYGYEASNDPDATISGPTAASDFHRRMTGGLSNEEAKTLLKQSLKQLISEFDRQTGNAPKLIMQGLWSMMFAGTASSATTSTAVASKAVEEEDEKKNIPFRFQWVNISGLVLFLQLMLSTIVLVASYVLGRVSMNSGTVTSQNHMYRLLIEAVLMALVFIVYIMGNVFKNWRYKKLLVQLLKNRFEKFSQSEFNFTNNEAKLFGIESVPMIAVCRDGHWVKLPYMHLAKGDLIFTLNPSRDIEYYHMQYSKTDHDGFYVLEETVISNMIHEALCTEDAEQRSALRTDFLSNVLAVLSMISLLITVPIGLIRVFVPSLGNYDWVELTLLQPIYVNIFLLPVAFPLLHLMLTTVANSRIIAVFNLLTKRYDKQKHAKYIQMDPSWKHRGIYIPLKLAAKYFFKNLFGLTKRMIAINDVLAIGSITTLCVFDKDGILSDTHYVPEMLLIVRSVDSSKQQILPQVMMEGYGHEGHMKQLPLGAAQSDKEFWGDTSANFGAPDEDDGNDEDNDDIPKIQEMESVHKCKYLDGGSDHIDHDNSYQGVSTLRDQKSSRTDNASLQEERVHSQSPNLAPHDNTSSDLDLVHDLDTCTDSQIENSDNLRPQYQTLDILFDRSNPDENTLSFQDEGWMEYIDSLKPLGLNCLINTASKFDTNVDGKEEESFSSMSDGFRPLWKKYIFSLGKVMGFSESVLDNFSFKKRLHTRRRHLEMSTVIVDYEEVGMQVQSHGHPELILEHCDDYWDGSDLRPLTLDVHQQIIKKYLEWSERKGLYCIALSYKPIDSRYDKIVSESQREPVIYLNLEPEEQMTRNVWAKLQRGQVFLGLVALRKPAKPDLPDFIQELGDDSGIRFIYFSPWNTQKTKDFGGKLGLETDWNSCISLNDDDDVELDESDVKAHLPHGIRKIRKHIETTDNVPLLMSLFGDAFPAAIKQMINILQENHESVCCVGSSTCLENLPLFAQGGVAIAVDPVSLEKDSEEEGRLNELVSSYHGFTQLLTFPCAFHIKSPSSAHSFQLLFHLIKEGRHMLSNLKQSFIFFLGCNLCMFCLQLSGSVFFLPPIINGLQSLWLMLIIIPILSLSMMSNPIEPRIMDLISSKNIPKNAKYLGRVLYTVIKFMLSIPFFLLMFTFALSSSPNLGISWGSIWGGQIPLSVIQSPDFQGALIFAQNIVMFFIALHFILLSVEFNHRIHSIFVVIPFKNWIWVLTCLAVLILQALFATVSCLAFGHGQPFPHIPFYIYIIVSVVPLIGIMVEELVKFRQRKKFFINQTRAKLKFGTRLGMYSPR